jgi:hypothetical protein
LSARSGSDGTVAYTLLNPAEKPWARSAEWCAESGKRKIRKMLKTMLLAIATLVILGVLTSNDFSLAQTGSETDPRFVISAQQLGIYGKAPHLDSAKLFAEWMITPEGQAAVAAVGRETSRKGVRSKASVEYAWGDKVKPIPIVNKSFSEDPRKWLDANVKPVWEN